jgi:HAD superfamily phosphatase
VKKMNDDYARFDFEAGASYVRKDMFECLRKVDAAIFDCDGVLIDIRDSYNMAIRKAVSFLVSKLTGAAFPEDLISRKAIFCFKRTGGFNNDWDLTYAILLLVLQRLPVGARKVLKQSAKEGLAVKSSSIDRLLTVSNAVKKELNAHDFGNVSAGLEDWLESFAAQADSSGIDSIERALDRYSVNTDSNGFSEDLRRLLSYPGDVEKSLLVRAFEEIYCGSQLFEEIYRTRPLFYHGRGLAENERVILEPQTLKELSSLFGRENFGISSGRSFELARRKLSKILDWFKHEAVIFLEDMLNSSPVNGWRPAMGLLKPNPFSLLRSSKGLKPFEYAVYVGDSMEDLMAVRMAKRVEPHMTFAGVYRYSDCADEILESFIESRAELVIPSINELPKVLRAIIEEDRK